MEKRYRVVLTAKGQNHIQYLRGLRMAFTPLLVLTEAIDFSKEVDPPFVLLDGVESEQAESAAKALRDHGAGVEVQESDYPYPMRFYRPDISAPHRPWTREILFPSLFARKRSAIKRQ